jgi:hypothetical protein
MIQSRERRSRVLFLLSRPDCIPHERGAGGAVLDVSGNRIIIEEQIPVSREKERGDVDHGMARA